MDSLSSAARAVEEKVEEFIVNSPQFKQSLNTVFNSIDFEASGYIGAEQAAVSVAWLFDSIQDALADYGVTVKTPSTQQLRQFFEAADKDANAKMSREEFKKYYISVLKYTAVECTTQIAQKYGIGAALGILGLFLAKKFVRKVPVVGLVARPFLAFVPTLLVGPVVGAAVMYSWEKKDVLALQKKFFPKKTAQFTAG